MGLPAKFEYVSAWGKWSKKEKNVVKGASFHDQ